MKDKENIIPVIRQEREDDFQQIRDLVKAAFSQADHTDGDEHNLIDRLRADCDYVPELALVYETDGEIIGHIMFSRVKIGNADAIALAPLAVRPDYWNNGIGTALINAAHQRARYMGYACSVVLGSPAYYKRSGYRPASHYGIIAPFDIPDEFYMVLPFVAPDKLPEGDVSYPAAFGI